MKELPSVPWYAAGLAFECTQCGRCCAGPEEGYVWVTPAEMQSIAKFLGITPQQMARNVRRVGRRTTIVEDSATRDCMFLKPNGRGGKGCSIYSVRPAQCRTWPFWPTNLSSPQEWNLAQQRCPGINRGQLHCYDEIETKRKATDG